MKKIFSAALVALLAMASVSSCSDVPAPYDILPQEEGGSAGVEGEGSKETPFDVTAAISKQDGKKYWVEGYIVGCVTGKTIEGASFTAPFESASNILIAASKEETNSANCLVIQLPGGSAVREGLNLKDNAANHGQKVKLYGVLTKYFGVSGMKETEKAVLGDKEIGDVANPQAGNMADLLDPSKTVASIANKFDDAVDNKAYENGYVNFVEKGNRTWRGKPNNSDMRIQATAYGSKNAEEIAWFITPAFVVNDLKVKQVSFDCVSAYYKPGTKFEVYFLEKEGNKVNQTLISVGDIPQNTDKAYDKIVNLKGDLTAFAGKTGFIGFKYVGGSEATGTYQIDNLYVGEENPGGSVQPEKPAETVVVTNDKPYEESFASSFGSFKVQDVTLGDLKYVWKIDATKKYAKASAYNGTGGVVAESHLVSPELDLTALKKAALTFSQCSFSAGKADEFMLKVKNITDNVDWTNVDFVMTTEKWKWIDNTVDLSAYAGKKIQIAFVYKNANTSSANTWEVKNVKVSNGEAGGQQGGGDQGGQTEPQKPADEKYQSNIELTPNSTDKAYDGKVSVDGVEYPVLKLGTTKAAGTWTSAALTANAAKMSFYVVGWTGKTGNLTVTIENGGSFKDGQTTKTIDLDGKTAGAAGNSPFTITPAASDFKEFELTGITATSTVKFTTADSTADKRAIIFGLKIK